MKIVEINSCNFGSTGKIMLQIADLARRNGDDVITCCPKSRDNMRNNIENQIFIGNRVSRNIHLKLGYLTGYNGCFSMLSTYRFLRKIDKIKPDIIHLHNLHNCYINLGMLFRYIKRKNISVVWTLHDCWSFTGQCPHFTMVKCEKWMEGCNHCNQYMEYPNARIDKTAKLWKLKKKWYCGVEKLIVVTPSKWLAGLVKQSFLSEYPVKVINNGIDLEIFKPTQSNYREEYNISKEKHIILGVSFAWGVRKGLDVFINLSKKLDKNKYQIILVGTTEENDKKLPKNIISIHKTRNQEELAKIYSIADVLVNPTREENYPTVNMEAIACGIPVITFRTGGSPEIVSEDTGSVVSCDDFDSLKHEIEARCEINPFSKEACLERAQSFDINDKFMEYIKLYRGIVKEI